VSIDRAVTTKTGGDLSPAEIAAATGLSKTLVYREIERGNLAAYRVGKVLRVERQDYLDWKERCRVRPRGEAPMYEPSSPGRRTRSSSGAFAERLAAVESARGVAA
jgi:excisionase family DNA binding protein